MRALWLSAGWLATLGIVAGLYLRWNGVGHPLLIAAVGLMPLALLPPLVTVAGAAWQTNSPSLRLATLGSAVVYAATFVSPSAAFGCGLTETEDQIVVLSHNTSWDLSDHDALADAVDAADPDIIVFQELHADTAAALAERPELNRYGFRANEIRRNHYGLAIWSRWEVRDAELVPVGDVPQLQAVVDTPDGPVTVRAIHLLAPLSRPRVPRWEAQLAALAAEPVPERAMMVGDFNATIDHAQFRSLLASGWTDAHEVKGCGLDATWPDGRREPFAILRLDHALVSPGFEVLGVELGPSAGSDHFMVVTTVRLADS